MNVVRRDSQVDRNSASDRIGERQDALAPDASRTIAVAATFTADPLCRPLRFWMSALGISSTVSLAPYAQIMQELLNPESLIAQNKSGFNAICIRIEDWLRDRRKEDVRANLDNLHRAVREFGDALETFCAKTSSVTFVWICPSSSALPPEYQKPVDGIQSDLHTRFKVLSGVHVVTHADLMRLYPVVQFEDPRTDRIAHIPFTDEYFVAIATWLARRIAALVLPPYKVIALDCDNTLWKGVCGEDGSTGVELTVAHLEFQRMLVQQHDAGMLLCLCTKNNQADVDAVFRDRPEMPLRREHLICSRVNWDAKSSNLQSLAEELNLSIDSFMLIDDSSLECAEVQAHCPSVLTMQFSQSPEEVYTFMHHVWAFDRVGMSSEARQRTAQYKENRERDSALNEAKSLQQFLDSLDLKVEVSPMQDDDLGRIAELIQRTNQFNVSGKRRNATEIDALRRAGEIKVLAIRVRDRFGDYGLVGAIFYQLHDVSLEIDTFVLSCRALGRGVEYRALNELGRMALKRGVQSIVLRFHKTSRNAPAWNFIDRSFSQFRSVSLDSVPAIDPLFTIPPEYAAGLRAVSYEVEQDEGPLSSSRTLDPRVASAKKMHQFAYRMCRIEDITREIYRGASSDRQTSADYIPPRSPTEAAIEDIWSEVLRLERVGVYDDFFELAGDSLAAVQVVARIESALDAELPLHVFFEEPTIAAISAKLTRAQPGGLIERASADQLAPLSSAQRRLWFIDQLEGGSVAYHIPLVLRIEGSVDRLALHMSLDALLERHGSLRAVVVQVEGQPFQKIQPKLTFSIDEVNLGYIAQENYEAELARRSQAELARPFDLATGPLIRGQLLHFSVTRHVLLLTTHHFVSDGWSNAILARELTALYGSYHSGLPIQLPSLPIEYVDYARWQLRSEGVSEQEEQLSYWKAQLLGAPELLELPTDRPRPRSRTNRGGSISVSLASDLVAKLRSTSRRLGLTLPMTLHAAWSLLLSRLSGQSDVVVGVPVANRRRTELEGLIGYFVNTLAIRLHVDDNESITAFLGRVKRTLLAAYAHQDAPFEQVVEALQPVRSLSYSPIFQAMFVMQPSSITISRFADATFNEVEVPTHTVKFDLSLSLKESAGELIGSVNYSSDLFDEATIVRWRGHFLRILDNIVGAAHLPISGMSLLDSEDWLTIDSFSGKAAAHPADALIQDLFEQQVKRTPDAVAVRHGELSVSFAELNRNANKLARYLRRKGVRSGHLAAICAERGLEMIVGLIGVLKSGGAYVPLDPNNPTERLQHLLADSNPVVLLTVDRLKADLPATHAEIVALDSDWDRIEKEDCENLNARELQLTPRSLAYVIYTSGSTGRPKGVMVEHRNVVNYAVDMVRQFGIPSGDGSLICTSMSFDLMLTGLYPPLLCGRPVRLCSEEHGLPAVGEEILRCLNLAPLKLTPSHLALLDRPLRNGELRGRVAALVLGGEPLTADAVRVWQEHAPGTRVFNHYGPTEATIGCIVGEIEKLPEDARGVLPLGRPIANTGIYILDGHGRPLPVGFVGEIYIGGGGVARGYLNRPTLSAERFLPDPFSADLGARMYRTGDMGRWRADGKVEFLGRRDLQVKLRGFRIELGEIEAQLRRHELVQTAAVLVRDDAIGGPSLVAYVVPDSTSTVALSAEALRLHLRAILPEYMVPTAWVMLERMPLTANGKLDRDALPAPRAIDLARGPYEPPQGEIEEVLAGVWQNLLRAERVSRHDSFFELGGHSLLIVQMMDRLRRVGLSGDFRQVFENPRLSELANALQGAPDVQHEPACSLIPLDCLEIAPCMLNLIDLDAESIEVIVRTVPGGAANVQDIYPLAPLQEGLLFHHLMSPEGGDIYVVPTLLIIDSRDGLEQFIHALQGVIDRHDTLRTAIVWEHLPRPVQVVYRRANLQVSEMTSVALQTSEESVREWLAPARQRMDLTQAPLIKLHVAPESDSARWHVLLQLHHIIGDAISLERIITEVAATLAGQSVTSSAPIPYRNHVAHALEYAKKDDAERFFRTKLAGIDEPTAPFGLTNVHDAGAEVTEARFLLDANLANRLRIQVRRRGVSAAALFHAAWALVVARASGRDDVVFGTVLLGRMHANAGAERSLGMFINTLPLRLKLSGTTAHDLLERTQRELVELLSHEQASLALAQRCSGLVAGAPLFTTLLNYRHSVADREDRWASASGVHVVATQSRTNYPLSLSVDDWDEGFALTAQADNRLNPDRVLGYMQVALQSMVQALEAGAQQGVLELPILPSEEYRQVVEEFNATAAPYPRESLIHEIFEECVRYAPDAIAIVDGLRSTTYNELNGEANRLAHFLRSRGIEAGEYVPVMMSRSPFMLISQIALLKCGAVYVPVDPELPAERRLFIVHDCSARFVLSDGWHVGQDLSLDRVTFLSRDVLIEGMAGESPNNLDLALDPTSSAYVMYTSGSTGLPKGVIVPHRAVNRLAINNGYAEIRARDCLAHYSSPAFDASTFEIWGALLNGARVVIVDQSLVLEPELFAEVLLRNDVTVLYMSVGLFNQYTNALADVFRRLRYLMVGGDALEPAAIRRVLLSSPPQTLLNVYGPTECTTFSTSHHVRIVDPAAKSVPIGRPISNSQIYILDSHLQPVPLGVVGEIYIGGEGVACGYLNRPELTAERFVLNPFCGSSQARIYKTGDLGRWLADGVVEYFGRNDLQVKIRGFRVELGEIESRLTQLPSVQNAVVLARQDAPGEKQLAAYILPTNRADSPTVQELRSVLREALPEYMVPSAFVVLDTFPLTPTGKVDRRSLPAPKGGAYATSEYEEPLGELEELLATIWKSLLRLDRVGRWDNFFELGGHSLLIVQMMERLRSSGLATQVRQVFESSSLADLASTLTRDSVALFVVPQNRIPVGCELIQPDMLPLIELEAEQIERIVSAVPGGSANIEDIYPLAPLQEGILFHHLLDESGGDPYVLPTLLSAATRERLDELIASLQAVIDNHDILRTAVVWEQMPQPLQIVYRHAVLPVEEFSLDPQRPGREQVLEWIKPERLRLDLRRAPLLRVRFAADLEAGNFYVFLQTHHITTDHVTHERLIAEVVARLQGNVTSSVEAVPYRSHVAQALAHSKQRDPEAFFRHKLKDIDEPTAPFGLLDTHGCSSRIKEAREQVPEDLATRVRAHARRSGVSAATMFHAAWALVVAHTSGRDDIVFGTVLLGRMQAGMQGEQALGMFINTLPLRFRLERLSAVELVEYTQRELIDLLTHEQASLAVAQRCSEIVGSAPLFSALLNYRHSAPNPAAEWSGADGIQLIAGRGRTNYPVTLSVDDMGEGFSLTAQTDQRVDASLLTAYTRSALEALLDALERSPDRLVLHLPVLPDKERLEVVERFNAAENVFRKSALVHELVEEQARRTPDAVAVCDKQGSITYGELDIIANQLARHLQSKGVGPDHIVAILVERSQNMVIALLATLKAGGAYMPLDPSYPAERLKYMLADAGPQIILTQVHLTSLIADHSTCDVVIVDNDWTEQSAHAADNIAAAPIGLKPDHLVYLIYTSGSTGRPKGTAMPHRSMVNLIEWHRSALGLGRSERVLQFAALSFDVAFQEIFSTLCDGGSLVLLEEWVRRDAAALMELLVEHGIERLFVPPLVLQSLAEHFQTTNKPHLALREVITAGEQLRVSSEIKGFLNHLPACRLHNHYGPTETHVVTALALSGDPGGWPALPAIGRPIFNSSVYILDRRRLPVAIGVAGEIYIGGTGVARGYRNRPELTADRFVPNPFSNDPGTCMYKTGDIGRWCLDGSIEYLGRNDDQVKIRGYRIELGEIESQLALHEQVKDVAVIASDAAQGGKRLVAYITTLKGEIPDADQLRTYLKDRLPDHMVPSAFVMLQSLPMTPSGKLDRRNLPEPDATDIPLQAYDPPCGYVEETLASIWMDVLRVTKLGRDSHFFELGGHSLLVMRALSKINHHFGATLRVTDFYKSPTIRELAGRLSGESSADALVDLSQEARLSDELFAHVEHARTPADALLLTGATGFVGRFIMAQLVDHTEAKIYCLVRGATQQVAASRLRESLSRWGLWSEKVASRVMAVPGDLKVTRFGMTGREYLDLSRAVDRIIHCGTSMNHLETYAMAKAANVESAFQLLKLATAERTVPINYVSTLGVFNSTAGDPMRIVHEGTPIDHEKHWLSRGYTASKWVGEKIFLNAQARGIPCNIFRLGLVWADSKLGRFDELQNVYRMMKSCLLSGVGIENYRYPMPPTPVDYVTRAIVHLATAHADGNKIFHIAAADQVVDGIFEQCSEIGPVSLKLLPYYEWICEMKRLHGEGHSMPAVPLIEFAFSMSKEEFLNHQRRFRSAASIRFDLTRTHAELEQAGIRAPVFDDDLLRVGLNGLVERDEDVREMLEARGYPQPGGDGRSFKLGEQPRVGKSE